MYQNLNQINYRFTKAKNFRIVLCKNGYMTMIYEFTMIYFTVIDT